MACVELGECGFKVGRECAVRGLTKTAVCGFDRLSGGWGKNGKRAGGTRVESESSGLSG